MTNSIWCTNSVGFLQEKLFIDSIAMHEKSDLIQGHYSSDILTYVCLNICLLIRFLDGNFLKVSWAENWFFAGNVIILLVSLVNLVAFLYWPIIQKTNILRSTFYKY